MGAVSALLLAQEDGARRDALARWTDFRASAAARSDDAPLAHLAARFQLDDFALQCLMLAVAFRIEPRMASIVAESGTELFTRELTVRVAVERFCGDLGARLSARQAFQPSSPLIRHRLIRVGPAEPGGADDLLGRRFEVTTPCLRTVLGESELAESVARYAQLEEPQVSLLNVILDPGAQRQVREIAELHGRYREVIAEWHFERVLPCGRGVILLLAGPPGTGKTLTAQALASHIKRPLLALSAADLPRDAGADAALRDVFAEATLRDAIVLVDECEALLGRGDPRRAAAFRALDEFEGIVVLTTNHPEQLDEGVERRILYHVPFEVPGPELRRQIWEVHLPNEVPLQGEVDLEALATAYDFAGGTIKNAVLFAVNRAIAKDRVKPAMTMALLEEGCRAQLRYALEELTVRTTTPLRLKDIVLPEEAHGRVAEILAAVRNHATVLNRWGFGEKLVTGRGITVLFDGAPGTGKTYCAEIIAGELDRPLYRVNLPEVVSKWVGETEKHIRAVFQQARVSHAMLLFDEADSLFASRVTETRSSNDRYANMEVNLLLQEIERFPGVCILTTNSYGALDRALVRRIQYRVTFEEPDAKQRALIWETLCPHQAPRASDVDFAALAKSYELTGGMIKNALLRAAYRACDGGVSLTQAHLERSCREECRAAGKLTRAPPLAAPEGPRRSG
jgi:SpoVK/Ycf46/Vps4 family AAA+-type ATPase